MTIRDRIWRLRAVRSLSSVSTTPVRVSVEGRVLGPNSTTSPLTGLTAVAFFWRFVSTYTRERSLAPGWQMNPWFEPDWQSADELGRHVHGGDIVLETEWGGVLVHNEALDVIAPGSPLGVVPLDRPLPEQLGRVFDAAKWGPVSVQEVALSPGDPMRLDAYVRRRTLVERSAYRSNDADLPPLVTCPERGPARLFDLSLSR